MDTYLTNDEEYIIAYHKVTFAMIESIIRKIYIMFVILFIILALIISSFIVILVKQQEINITVDSIFHKISL